jgi:chemotaxis protein methyltransferase CheR
MNEDRAPMTISRTDFDYVRQVLRKYSAITLDDGKEYLAESRLHALARKEGIQSIGELVGRLRSGQGDDLRRKVVESMTTNETSFFRDVHPFEELRTTILPELCRLRASEKRLNVWCAACSSGQEPYSLAMLIHEHFPELSGWRLRILGTDLSTEMVERSKKGRYSQMEVTRGVPVHMLLKYFRRDGLDWDLTDEIRRMVEFRPMNLIEPWPYLESMDLILLRNVLIYFDGETKKSVLAKAAKLLKPDGCLILGGTEATLFMEDSLERVSLGRTSVYRRQVQSDALKNDRPVAPVGERHNVPRGLTIFP